MRLSFPPQGEVVVLLDEDVVFFINLGLVVSKLD
jgi:hypothetical protein